MPRPRFPETLPQDLLGRLRARFHPWELIKDWGLTLASVDPGRAVMRLVPARCVQNQPRGNVNGGVLASMADITGALALSTAFDGAMPFATSDLHIRYLEPARGEVMVEAEVLRVSGRGAIVECRMTCGGTLVALCTANFAIRQGVGG